LNSSLFNFLKQIKNDIGTKTDSQTDELKSSKWILTNNASIMSPSITLKLKVNKHRAGRNDNKKIGTFLSPIAAKETASITENKAPEIIRPILPAVLSPGFLLKAISK